MDTPEPGSAQLFVYGTLIREALSRGGQRATLRGFDLYNISWFPGIVASADADATVRGVVFPISNPAEFDHYEGYRPSDPKGSLYLRQQVTVTTDDGQAVPAWVYVYNQSVERRQQIKDGAWRHEEQCV